MYHYKRLPILAIFLTVSIQVLCQDEGTISKKAAFAKGRSIHLIGGPSFKLGKGDYSTGLNLEAGYLRRINKIISVGPSISFSKFKYDKSISDSFGNEGAEGNNIYIDFYEVKIVYLQGGDLSFFTLGFDIMVNMIPGQETKGISVYGIVKPFLLFSNRSAVRARVEQWFMNDLEDDKSLWYYGGGPDESLSPSSWNTGTELNGGLNVGIGAKYVLPSGFTLFLQSTVGVVMRTTFINTTEYPSSYSGYNDTDNPFVKGVFTILNVSTGIAYSF